MSAEDPSASRSTRASPSHQRNGHEDRAGSVSRTEERRGSTRQTQPEHLSTGPASRAARSSSSSVVNNEYYTGRDQASRSDHSFREQAVLRQGSGGINGPLQAQQEHFLGRMRYRESPSSSRPSVSMSHELDQSSKQLCQKVEPSPAHSIMGDFTARNREQQSSSPLTFSHMMGSRSASPASDTLHQKPLSYTEQNGYCSTPSHFNDGRSSPILSRFHRHQKQHKVHQPSNAEPNQGASSPGQESRPVMTRAERMAALERRMTANGLSAPGRSRAGMGQKRLRSAGVSHMGAVQMNECSTTSGSESSESEVENNRGNHSSPVMFGNTAGTTCNSPIPRNKFSFGSLQLDEEADEDSHAFSDEEGGQIFSC